MLIHKEKLTITPSSGTGSGKTIKMSGLMVHSITIAPATGSTTWNISISDEYSDVIFNQTSQTGTVARQTYLPFRGIYTVSITSASVDEAFKVVFWCKEEVA